MKIRCLCLFCRLNKLVLGVIAHHMLQPICHLNSPWLGSLWLVSLCCTGRPQNCTHLAAVQKGIIISASLLAALFSAAAHAECVVSLNCFKGAIPAPVQFAHPNPYWLPQPILLCGVVPLLQGSTFLCCILQGCCVWHFARGLLSVQPDIIAGVRKLQLKNTEQWTC